MLTNILLLCQVYFHPLILLGYTVLTQKLHSIHSTHTHIYTHTLTLTHLNGLLLSYHGNDFLFCYPSFPLYSLENGLKISKFILFEAICRLLRITAGVFLCVNLVFFSFLLLPFSNTRKLMMVQSIERQ